MPHKRLSTKKRPEEKKDEILSGLTFISPTFPNAIKRNDKKKSIIPNTHR